MWVYTFRNSRNSSCLLSWYSVWFFSFSISWLFYLFSQPVQDSSGKNSLRHITAPKQPWVNGLGILGFQNKCCLCKHSTIWRLRSLAWQEVSYGESVLGAKVFDYSPWCHGFVWLVYTDGLVFIKSGHASPEAEVQGLGWELRYRPWQIWIWESRLPRGQAFFGRQSWDKHMIAGSNLPPWLWLLVSRTMWPIENVYAAYFFTWIKDPLKQHLQPAVPGLSMQWKVNVQFLFFRLCVYRYMSVACVNLSITLHSFDGVFRLKK